MGPGDHAKLGRQRVQSPFHTFNTGEERLAVNAENILFGEDVRVTLKHGPTTWSVHRLGRGGWFRIQPVSYR